MRTTRLTAAQSAPQMNVVGVINLAPAHVPSFPEALPEPCRQFYVDVRAADGQPLTDKVSAKLPVSRR